MSRALSRARRLRDALQTLGVGRLAPELLRWTVRRRFVVFARDLEVACPGEDPDPDLRWSDLSPVTVASLLAGDPALGAGEIDRWQREGQHCRLCWRGEQLVHYRSDTTQPAYLPYLGRWFRPAVGDVLTSWLYTAPSWRGRGIQRASHADLREQALARGCRRALGIVAAWNAPSLLANDHTGRRRVGTVAYVVLGPWRRYAVSGAVRIDDDGYVTVEASHDLDPAPGHE